MLHFAKLTPHHPLAHLALIASAWLVATSMLSAVMAGDLDALNQSKPPICRACDLHGARLKKAELQNADLTGAKLDGAILKGAVMPGGETHE